MEGENGQDMQQTLQENPFERTTEANRPLWRPAMNTCRI